MTAPFFSIVTPTYNRAELLSETLASVWAQEFTDYEVIVVDDGSTDGTREWLPTLGDRALVLTQSNRGPGAARNLALEHARGEYIAFLDSDDLWFPWSLATYAEVIQRHGEPSFITGSVLRFEHPHLPHDVLRDPLAVEVFGDYLASGDKWRWYGLSSFVVKRELIDSVGAFSNEPINGEDADLALRLGSAPGFVHVTAPFTFAYREHSGGVRHQARKSFQGTLNLLNQENSGRFPGGSARARQRWRIIGRQLRPCAIGCLHAGLPSEAWQLYRATWRRHLREGRWQFLAGFPVVAAACALRRDRGVR